MDLSSSSLATASHCAVVAVHMHRRLCTLALRCMKLGDLTAR
ncbi:MAG TPA: hypothetical protein VKK81_11540 [Candidatus Binatia bacterium]|nr:hypothetical protein [Candidatus Binatia bacterium]